jgi:hypothetical protein
MSYGMKLINQDGTTAYDSTSPGGVFVQFVTLPIGTNTSQQTLNLPVQYRGMNLIAYPILSGDHTYVLVQGNIQNVDPPRILWSNRRAVLDTVNRSQTILMIFAT